MKSPKNAVSRMPRTMCHAAAVLVMGCSAGAGDSSTGAEDAPVSPVVSQVGQELRGLAHRPPTKDPHHRPPPPPPVHHHPGPGSGCGAAAGSPGAAGSSGSGGSASGTGGASASGGSNDQGASGGAPEGGFVGAGGVSAGGSINFPDPCGDGLQLYNPCDDGNTVSGDGCSATCDIEPGYVCVTPGQPCRVPRCGDGFQDAVFVPSDPSAAGGAAGEPSGAGGAAGSGTYFVEACDDGNTAPGDGCSATCEVESGFICPTPGAPCREPRCGDGFQDPIPLPGGAGGAGGAPAGGAPDGAGGTTSTGGGPFEAGGSAGAGGFYGYESCDDGNTASGDGCSASCDVEPGYVCVTPNTPCRLPRCGDGVVDYYYPSTEPSAGGAPSTEPGAGGAAAAAGGASASAGGAPGGFSGSSSGGSFASGGSGGAGPAEQCDDGNTASGDGCSATCQAE